MSVRAASLAVVFGALVLSGAWAAERMGPAAPTPASNDFPVASGVRLGGDDTLTRVVADFSEKFDIRAFTLADPYRVVIDMPQVTFQFPPKTGEAGRGLIKAFRYGLVMPGGSRIVIDLTRPGADRESLRARGRQRPAGAADARPCGRPTARRSCAPSRSRTAPRRAAASRSRSAGRPSSADPRPLVVIDPGHGGLDNGTKAGGGEHGKDHRARFLR